MSSLIRPYQSLDRQAVYRIAADTAFFGAPVETYLEDRKLFNEAFYYYYTEVETGVSWVACIDEQVVGFIMGCVDSRVQERWLARRWLPVMVGRVLGGRYKIGYLTLRYGLRLARAGLLGEFPHADLSLYPAHLHINLDQAARGHGLGRKLMEAYLDQLRWLGVPGVHLNTTDQNKAACYLYEKIGFRILDARVSHVWEGWVQGRVENRCYGMLLGAKNL